MAERNTVTIVAQCPSFSAHMLKDALVTCQRRCAAAP